MKIHHQVASSLTFDSLSGSIDFKGCNAEITGETSSYFFVRFYTGSPFMISKIAFLSATDPCKPYSDPEFMQIHDVTLWLNGEKIKSFRTLLFPNDPEYHQIKEKAAKWFKLAYGTDYNKATTVLIEDLTTETTMAKTTKVKTENIEVAEVIDETTDALTVAKKIAQTLPSIPDVFFIDGEEYSLAVVNELGKKADALLAKATPETYNSVAIWEEVKSLKTELVKMRTTPDNKRKELSKPFQEFVKEVKSKTDAVGEAAKAHQDKLDAALQAKEDHEAELARIENERIVKRTELRKEELRGLGGVYDIENGTFSFPYNPGVIVNQMQLMEYDEPTWANERSLLTEAYSKEQARIQEEKEKQAAEQSAAQEALSKAKEREVIRRGKELRFEGFEFNEGLQAWQKNGWSIMVQNIADRSDEEWDEFIASANEPHPGQEPLPYQQGSPATQVTPPPTIMAPPSFATQSSTGLVSDPLGAVISGMTQQHGERVDDLDGIVKKQLTFTKEKPYIDIVLNKTFLRIYPAEFDQEANDRVSPDKIKSVIRNEELGLAFAIIAL